MHVLLRFAVCLFFSIYKLIHSCLSFKDMFSIPIYSFFVCCLMLYCKKKKRCKEEIIFLVISYFRLVLALQGSPSLFSTLLVLLFLFVWVFSSLDLSPRWESCENAVFGQLYLAQLHRVLEHYISSKNKCNAIHLCSCDFASRLEGT